MKYSFIRISKLEIILLLAALLVSPLGHATATPIDEQQEAGITIKSHRGIDYH